MGLGWKMKAFRWEPIPLTRRSLNPFLELLHFARLYRTFAREKPDLVHNFTIKCVVYGSLAARLLGVPAVINGFDGLGYVFSNRSVKAQLTKWLIKPFLRASSTRSGFRTVVLNSADRDALVSDGLAPPHWIRLIEGGVGVDVRRFHPAEHPPDAEKPVVLFASRLLLDKGIAEFVDVALEFKRKRAPCKFIVAGMPDPGNPNSVTPRQLDEWKRSECVEFVGHCDDMPELLRSASVLVLTTTYGEGLPRILLEAAASGVAIIGSDRAACRQIVKPNETGLLVPPRDVAALSGAVSYLLDHPGERMRMARNAREKVRNEFDEERALEQMLNVYREVAPASKQHTG